MKPKNEYWHLKLLAAVVGTFITPGIPLFIVAACAMWHLANPALVALFLWVAIAAVSYCKIRD